MTKDESPDSHPPQGILQGCPLDRVLRLLSGEWTTHILWVLSTNGPTRHGALKRLIGGISSKVLTDRLRMPEAEGVVYSEGGPRLDLARDLLLPFRLGRIGAGKQCPLRFVPLLPRVRYRDERIGVKG